MKLSAIAEAGALLKKAFEDEQGPVTLLNFVPAAEAWQPGEKELRQKGGMPQLIGTPLQRTSAPEPCVCTEESMERRLTLTGGEFSGL